MTAVIIKTPAPKPIVKMIVPGRRALGETWQEVTIGVKDDEIQVTENVPAEAPPDGRPVVIPAMGELPADAINYILGSALQKQEYERRRPRRRPVSDAEIEKMANEMWQSYAEAKVKAYLGVSQFGPGGKTQRESFTGAKNRNGVNPR